MKPADSASRSLEGVRPARPDESKLLASLHVTTWQQAYEGLLPSEYLASLTPDQRLPMWEHLLTSPEKVAIFVADSDGGPIGFSCGGISNDQGAETTTGELWSIYLLREFWNLGIGKQLHDRLLQELARRGFSKATLWVMESNIRTCRWYERQGWALDGSRKTDELWGTTVDEVRYQKVIRSGYDR